MLSPFLRKKFSEGKIVSGGEKSSKSVEILVLPFVAKKVFRRKLIVSGTKKDYNLLKFWYRHSWEKSYQKEKLFREVKKLRNC